MGTIGLTDTTLLHVFHYCDIPTIKNLRLVNRWVHDLTAAYEHSIARVMAIREFSEDTVRKFRPYKDPKLSFRSIFCIESRQRRAQWLAGVVLEQNCEDGRTNYVLADDPIGDPLRAHIINGWSILWHLTDIAIDTEGELSRYIAPPVISNRSVTASPISVARILDGWLKFVTSLSFDERLDYDCMRYFAASAFSCRVFEDPHREEYEIGTGNEFARKTSWLSWLVLKDGPLFFEKAWASKEGNERCVKYIYQQFSQRSRNQQLWEFDAARKTELALEGQGKEEVMAYRLVMNVFDSILEQRVLGHQIRNIPFFIGYRLSSLRIRQWDNEENMLDQSYKWRIPGVDYSDRTQFAGGFWSV
jgi:hypothetical protein